MGSSNRLIIEELVDLYSVDDSASSYDSHPAREQKLASLTTDQLGELETSINFMITSEDASQLSVAENIMLDLLVFTNVGVDSLIVRMIMAQGYIAESLFRGGGASTKDLLRNILPSNPDLGLIGLAWIADSEVVSQFAEWKQIPPSWATQINLPAHEYSYVGGWELTADNQKRDLFSKTCFGVTRSQSTGTKSGDNQTTCIHCRRPLFTTILDAHYLNRLYSIAVPVDHFEIPFCDLCTGSVVMYSTIRESGRGQIVERALRSEDVPQWYFDADADGGLVELAVDTEARDPFYAAQAFARKTCSQIGGHPTWLQDAKYPKCSGCGRTMLFLMQIDTDEFENLYPGTFYTFTCDLCPNRLAVCKQHT